jgi:hypothetical protein
MDGASRSCGSHLLNDSGRPFLPAVANDFVPLREDLLSARREIPAVRRGARRRLPVA